MGHPYFQLRVDSDSGQEIPDFQNPGHPAGQKDRFHRKPAGAAGMGPGDLPVALRQPTVL